MLPYAQYRAAKSAPRQTIYLTVILTWVFRNNLDSALEELLCFIFCLNNRPAFRSQWPRSLRRGSAASSLLVLRFRSPPGARMFVSCIVCCQVVVSATGWSLVQMTPTECGVSECDREAWTMRRPWSTGGRCAMENTVLPCYALPHLFIRGVEK
jgi:hypothetical protein